MNKKIVVLGTGGTIAGASTHAQDNVGYAPGQVGVRELFDAAMSGLTREMEIEIEQIAQIDSKDMSFQVWAQLAQRAHHHLAQDDVKSVLVTHGTDTLEETAYFLHRLFQLDTQGVARRIKPLVITCAMRPSTALSPDGPQNLRDALVVAQDQFSHGVLVVCAAKIHTALAVRKVYSYQPDAFDSGEAGPIGWVEEGRVRWMSEVALLDQVVWNLAGLPAWLTDPESWPRVELLTSHVGADGMVVDALLKYPGRPVYSPQDGPGGGPMKDRKLEGLVVAGTGNGTLHIDLVRALREARNVGIRVVRVSRCARGSVIAVPGDEFESGEGLSAVKARIDLMFDLLAHRRGSSHLL